MSTTWSLWVLVLMAVNLGITLFLFFWSDRVKIPVEKDGTSGHQWAHGVLREGVRPLPRWWFWMSLGTFIFAGFYFFQYPAVGLYQGQQQWTSDKALQEASEKNALLLQPLMERAQTLEIAELAKDRQATIIGQRLFIDNCAACHGNNALGIQAIGAPNLLDAATLYGNDDETILLSIREGRTGIMPGWQHMGYGKIKNLAHYVRSLSGESHDAEAAKVSEKHFAICGSCHGMDGKGNPLLGAPDLTDKDSSYGNSLEQIIESITHGRNGVMPALKNRLSEAEMRLITAWIKANDSTQNTTTP